MSEYIAPIKDMMFVIKDVVGAEELPQFKSGELDFETTEAILEEAGKLATNVLSPINHIGDVKGNELVEGKVKTAPGFKDAYQEYYQGGWNAVPFTDEYGGQNLPWLLSFPVTEMWQASNTSFSLCAILGQAAVEAIELHGSKEQKDTYLEKLITGEWTGTMNLTEPQAGSDLAAIKAKAEKQEDGSYLIKGQKIYITYGEHDFTDNIIHMVLARTPDAPEGVKGISLFIVPKMLLNDTGEPDTKNDVICTALEHKLGINASPTCVMQYGEKDGAVGYLVGKENEGLKYMFTMMNNARLCIGLQGVGVAERAFQQALDYAQERVQGVAINDKKAGAVSIISHPDVKRMLLEMKAKVEAGRMMAYEAAKAIDLAKEGNQTAQDKADLLTPIVKAWCTDMGVDVASIGVQVHGGMGFIEETGAAQHYRDARIMPIYEGTNGIQANDLVFRKTLMNGGKLADDWFKEVEQFLLELKDNKEFGDMHKVLKKSLDKLKDSTEWVVKTGANDNESVASVAVPYQKAFGDIMGGVMMAKAAVAAQKQLDSGDNTNFYFAKIKTAEFYTTHVLPASLSSLETVMSGANVVKEFKPNMFHL
jgi:alkylation response protein AidB-like acyl-CoA dehydrogenase